MFFCNKLYLIARFNNAKLRHILGAVNMCEEGIWRDLEIVMEFSIFGSPC